MFLKKFGLGWVWPGPNPCRTTILEPAYHRTGMWTALVQPFLCYIAKRHENLLSYWKNQVAKVVEMKMGVAALVRVKQNKWNVMGDLINLILRSAMLPRCISNMLKKLWERVWARHPPCSELHSMTTCFWKGVPPCLPTLFPWWLRKT